MRTVEYEIPNTALGGILLLSSSRKSGMRFWYQMSSGDPYSRISVAFVIARPELGLSCARF